VIAENATADMIASDRQWSTGNSKIDGLIRYYGTQHGVDPYLIYCLMSQESGFTAGATSNKGAQGLMQLMPGTAARYGVTNPYDVAQNIKGGTRYLKDLLKMFNGRVDLALAGYNAGEGAVMKYGNTVPPYSETRNYVRLILLRYGKKT
jgi:soluble lytic murein transglycosylase-like protein